MSTEQIRVLVTGGCGFLGTEIVAALLATNRFAITAIDINPPALGTSTFTQTVRYVRANIMDRDALQKVFDEAKPAIVVHTVGVYRLGTARYSMKNKEGEFTVNVEGTRNVLDASKECGAKGLVYTSSVTVLLDELGKDFRNVDEDWPTGRAKTSYGQSKVCPGSVFHSNPHMHPGLNFWQRRCRRSLTCAKCAAAFSCSFVVQNVCKLALSISQILGHERLHPAFSITQEPFCLLAPSPLSTSTVLLCTII